jgi:membrane protease YdiL (CAAX protease family)
MSNIAPGIPDFADWESYGECESLNVSPASGRRQGKPACRRAIFAMNSHAENAAGFRLAILIEGSLGLAAILLAWLFDVPLRAQFATATESAWAAARGVVATLPLLAGFWWLVHAQSPGLRKLREQVLRMVREMFRDAPLGQLALVAGLAGVSEELLFRGVLQTLVGRWFTPLVGLVVASLIFGVLHAISRLYFVLATLVAAYLGWMLLEFGDLLAPIVTHALYDFVALAYLCRFAAHEKVPHPVEVPDERSSP